MPLKNLRSLEILISTTSQTALAAALTSELLPRIASGMNPPDTNATERVPPSQGSHFRPRSLQGAQSEHSQGRHAQLGLSHFERTGSCCSGRTCRNSSSAQAARPARACSPGPCGRRTGSDPERRNLCARRRTTSARCRSPHPAIVMMLSRVSETEARQIEKVSLFYVVRRHDEQGRIPHSLPDQLIRPVSSPVQVSETVPAQLDGTQGITRTRCPSLCPSRSAWSRRHGPPCSLSPPEFAPTPAAPRTARAQTGTSGGGRRGGRGCGLGSDRSRSPSLHETKTDLKIRPKSRLQWRQRNGGGKSAGGGMGDCRVQKLAE